jgi:hypothetical protein
MNWPGTGGAMDEFSTPMLRKTGQAEAVGGSRSQAENTDLDGLTAPAGRGFFTRDRALLPIEQQKRSWLRRLEVLGERRRKASS